MKKAKYFVYWNLHKNIFSVKYKGRVIYHLSHFAGLGCEFKVSEKGRKRVIREQVKNVHAYAICESLTIRELSLVSYKIVTYNPYTDESFMAEGQPIFESPVVVFEVVDGKPIVKAAINP